MMRLLPAAFFLYLLPGVAQSPAGNFSSDVDLAAARNAEAQGRYSEAEAAYVRFLASHEDPEVHQRLGLVRHLQNNFAGAIPEFEKAVAGNPRLWGSHLFLGMGLYRTNRFRDALSHLRTAGELQPGQKDVLFWTAASQLALGETLAGLAKLERFLALEPASADALRLLAEHHAGYGTALWNRVAEKRFDSAAGQQIHGRALEMEGAHEAALAAYRKSLALAPRRAGVHLGIARVLMQIGDRPSAQAELRNELRNAPGDPEASFLLGTLLQAEGKSAEAKPLLDAGAKWGYGVRN